MHSSFEEHNNTKMGTIRFLCLRLTVDLLKLSPVLDDWADAHVCRFVPKLQPPAPPTTWFTPSAAETRADTTVRPMNMPSMLLRNALYRKFQKLQERRNGLVLDSLWGRLVYIDVECRVLLGWHRVVIIVWMIISLKQVKMCHHSMFARNFWWLKTLQGIDRSIFFCKSWWLNPWWCPLTKNKLGVVDGAPVSFESFLLSWEHLPCNIINPLFWM